MSAIILKFRKVTGDADKEKIRTCIKDAGLNIVKEDLQNQSLEIEVGSTEDLETKTWNVSSKLADFDAECEFRSKKIELQNPPVRTMMATKTEEKPVIVAKKCCEEANMKILEYIRDAPVSVRNPSEADLYLSMIKCKPLTTAFYVTSALLVLFAIWG